MSRAAGMPKGDIYDLLGRKVARIERTGVYTLMRNRIVVRRFVVVGR